MHVDGMEISEMFDANEVREQFERSIRRLTTHKRGWSQADDTG